MCTTVILPRLMDMVAKNRFLFLALGGVLLLLCVWLIILRIVSRRHDRQLERELKQETEAMPRYDRTTLLPAVQREDLPPEKPTVFMPVPTNISDAFGFVSEQRDGVCVRSCVRAEDADKMMTAEQANTALAVIFRPGTVGTQTAFVFLDTLSDFFSPFSYINLTILKQCGLVAHDADSLSVEARGVVRKPLIVEADEFTTTAVKMLSLTGGRAVQMKKEYGLG